MRHITENNIVSIVANSEDSNFPADRCLDEHPKRVYKAASGVNTAVLVAEVIGGCSDVMVAGTNAASATVSAEDPNVTDWNSSTQWAAPLEDIYTRYTDTSNYTDTDNYTLISDSTSASWGNTTVSVTGSVTQRSKSNSLWIQLSESVNVPVQLTLTLSTSAGTTLEAGVITANLAETYGGVNPNYGLATSMVDYSVRAENSNGSLYYKKRDIVRSFSIPLLMARENAFALQNNYEAVGELPTAWKITDLSSNEWVVYGKFNGPPQVSHDYPNHSTVSFEILEVL